LHALHAGRIEFKYGADKPTQCCDQIATIQSQHWLIETKWGLNVFLQEKVLDFS